MLQLTKLNQKNLLSRVFQMRFVGIILNEINLVKMTEKTRCLVVKVELTFERTWVRVLPLTLKRPCFMHHSFESKHGFKNMLETITWHSCMCCNLGRVDIEERFAKKTQLRIYIKWIESLLANLDECPTKSY